VKLNLETNEVDGVIKFDNGATVFVQGGNNIGRVGILQSITTHAGSYDIAQVKDANGRSFATRKDNIFVIGETKNPVITLPKKQGLSQTLLEERDERLGRVADDEEEDGEEEGEAAGAGGDDDSDE